MNKTHIGGGILLVIIIFIIALLALLMYRQAFAPTSSTLPTGTPPAAATIEVIAEDLSIPWEIVWLPDSETMLITERPGTLLQITEDGEQRRIDVPRVSALGEGGLTGMVLHPDFTENQWLYLYRTYQEDTAFNEVVRYRYDSEAHELLDETTIIDNIPGASYHDGGRIAFGPDGYLYITTGDAGTPELAQNRSSLAGKILRLTDTGDIPSDNPFGTPVYSYGHRNPQGIAWDSQGQLWSTEHGRSGLQSGMDELNRIESGANYGWPTIEGDETNSGMQRPITHSGPDETWAPADLAAVDDTLFFGGLRGARLYRATIQSDTDATLHTFFSGEYGRIRTTAPGPDQALYLLTSNTDGRGTAEPNDDRLIRVPHSEILSN